MTDVEGGWGVLTLELDIGRVCRGLRLVADELRAEAALGAVPTLAAAVAEGEAETCDIAASMLEDERDVRHLIRAGALLIESVHALGVMRSQRAGVPTWGR